MKKSNRWIVFLCLIGLCLWGVVIWLTLVAPPPPREMASVRVKVVQLPPPETPAPVVQEQATPESDQPQVASAIIPPPSTVIHRVGGPPRIAIVIDDMGLNLTGSERAERLPKAITLSFMPYAPRLADQTGQAREDGHELLLHMPMEPMGNNDPGPGALLTNLSPEEIRSRFQKGLDSFKGFDGVNNHMGSKFTSDAAGMEIVIDELQKHNLFFLDSRTSPHTVGEKIAKQHGLPTLGRDIFLDDDMSAEAVRTQLARTEYVAKRQGYAIAIGHPHEVTLNALEAWLPEAQKRGFVFIPLHDLLKTPAK
jgi:polysaccharide deacetylase 2 family uncharacterized protein YibQ